MPDYVSESGPSRSVKTCVPAYASGGDLGRKVTECSFGNANEGGPHKEEGEEMSASLWE